MCKCLQVSRSSYYEWLKKDESTREKVNKELIKMIKGIFEKSRSSYGPRRIKKELAKQNMICSLRRIGRLMESEGLACKTKRKFKATTDSKHNLPVSPNLLARQFQVSKPDRYWVGDITYIPTEEGWLYLAVVIDLYSRKVIGWSMSNRMTADLVNNAIFMAIWSRKPAKNLIWHTDRGSQYASRSHRNILRQHGIIQSMSRKGNCWDNAVSESFFGTLKTELIHHYKFKTREDAHKIIFEYIEVFYNRIRIHSANDYLSPVEFESLQKSA